MKLRNIIIVGVVILIIILGIIGLKYLDNNKPIKVDKDFSKVDLTGVNKVMFVAHPDDEIIWGGAHLILDGSSYLVVCVTCGVKKERVEEFFSVMEKTNSKYIMLGYPDKTNGKKDKWETSKDGIRKDVKDILKLKNWDLIVTHNPEGEYGHIQHVMTDEIITDVSDKTKLMYFGKYYKKTDIDNYKDGLDPIDESIYNKKYEILELYKSQDFIFDMFGHMFYYENWVSYEDWYNEG